jgi:hypothetical protein
MKNDLKVPGSFSAILFQYLRKNLPQRLQKEKIIVSIDELILDP